MTLLCDCDGVLADFIGGMCRELRAYGFPYTEDSFDCFSPTMPPAVQEAWDEIYRRPGFCYGLDWYPGAKDFFLELQRLDKVIVVTAPGPGSTWHYERQEWLSGVVHSRDVVFCDASVKPLLLGRLLVEDRAETVEHWGGASILIDRPWNRVLKSTPMCTRSYSYDGALERIRHYYDRL